MLSLDIVLEELIKQLLDGDINFVQFIVQKLFLKIIGLTYINFNFIPCKEFTKMVTINFFFVNLISKLWKAYQQWQFFLVKMLPHLNVEVLIFSWSILLTSHKFINMLQVILEIRRKRVSTPPRSTYKRFKVNLSRSKIVCFICFNKNSLKIIKNAIYSS